MLIFILKMILLLILHFFSVLTLMAVVYLEKPECLVVWNSMPLSAFCGVLNLIFYQIYVFILYRIKEFRKEGYKVAFWVVNYVCLGMILLYFVIMPLIVDLTHKMRFGK